MKQNFNKEAFLDYYEGLPDDEKRRVRDEFLDRTGLSYPSWYTKRTRGRMSKPELAILSEITGRDFSNQ